MFNNISKKCKGLAKAICCIGIISTIIVGIVLIVLGSESYYSNTRDTYIVCGIATIIIGPLFSYFGSIVIYAIGEAVENSAIAANLIIKAETEHRHNKEKNALSHSVTETTKKANTSGNDSKSTVFEEKPEIPKDQDFDKKGKSEYGNEQVILSAKPSPIQKQTIADDSSSGDKKPPAGPILAVQYVESVEKHTLSDSSSLPSLTKTSIQNEEPIQADSASSGNNRTADIKTHEQSNSSPKVSAHETKGTMNSITIGAVIIGHNLTTHTTYTTGNTIGNTLYANSSTLSSDRFVSGPDRYGLASLLIRWQNQSGKEIKRIHFHVQAYNRIRERIGTVLTLKSTGPFKDRKLHESQWGPLWEDPSISYARVIYIEIDYMDGTTEKIETLSIINSMNNNKANSRSINRKIWWKNNLPALIGAGLVLIPLIIYMFLRF